MAIDEALLEAALDRGDLTVRWYRWETATVSLGYFQDAASAAASPAIAGLPVVRRLSGGGAILHHHEWTYSCAVPSAHPFAVVPARLYEVVHEQIIACLKEAGLPGGFRGERLAEREGTFLCFGRGDPRDIVVGKDKIVGSAQRRRRGAVLQHGSVLLRRSEYAGQFAGILDLFPCESLARELPSRFASRAQPLFDCSSVEEELGDCIDKRAAELEPHYRTLVCRREIANSDADPV
jgi:lipoate-protein ligase A